ncbi:MAG: hypothetical protein ACTSXZ_08430 [Alphaproteobacteria bacterium]
MKRRGLIVFFLVLTIALYAWLAYSEEQAQPLGFFSNSLHHTGEGMRYWYEAEDGFMAITKKPYQELGCKNCHAKNCDVCHAQETENGMAYSTEIARKTETCLKCHAREGGTFKLDRARGTLGVHIAANMACIDCHSAREVHGDGTFYHSMRNPKAKDAKCTNCHTGESTEYAAIPDTASHQVHGDKVHCNACHVQAMMNCYNCHFGEFARTGHKPTSFPGKNKEWLLLINYQGQVTSASMQTLVGYENEPFIIYTPYYTHSIMREGRKCKDCHGSEAVVAIANGQSFHPASFENGQLSFYQGVIPTVPELLEWIWMEKVDGEWRTFEPDREPLIQMGLFGTAITPEQLEKLKQSY